MPTGSKSAA
jgi:antitoxin VapB